MPLSRLAPIIIEQAKKMYKAIIIDPLYKVMDGDENSNSDVGYMVSQFDRIARETAAAVSYAHHFAKGVGGDRAAIDRGAGAGTFARDPDAILDLIELNPAEAVQKYMEQVSDACGTLTAWEISGTLREFPPEKPARLWFDYPIHVIDQWNFLAEAKYLDMGQRGVGRGQNAKEDVADMMEDLFNVETFEINEALDIERVKDAFGVGESAVRNKYAGSKSNFETVTIEDGTVVVFRRGQNPICYKGIMYDKTKLKNKRAQRA